MWEATGIHSSRSRGLKTSLIAFRVSLRRPQDGIRAESRRSGERVRRWDPNQAGKTLLAGGEDRSSSPACFKEGKRHHGYLPHHLKQKTDSVLTLLLPFLISPWPIRASPSTCSLGAASGVRSCTVVGLLGCLQGAVLPEDPLELLDPVEQAKVALVMKTMCTPDLRIDKQEVRSISEDVTSRYPSSCILLVAVPTDSCPAHRQTRNFADVRHEPTARRQAHQGGCVR